MFVYGAWLRTVRARLGCAHGGARYWGLAPDGIYIYIYTYLPSRVTLHHPFTLYPALFVSTVDKHFIGSRESHEATAASF